MEPNDLEAQRPDEEQHGENILPVINLFEVDQQQIEDGNYEEVKKMLKYEIRVSVVILFVYVFLLYGCIN